MDYPPEDEVRRRLKLQGVLNEDQIDECIRNTDLLLDFEDIVLDKKIKLPKNYLFNGEWVGDKTQGWRDKTLRDLVYENGKKQNPQLIHQDIKNMKMGLTMN